MRPGANVSSADCASKDQTIEEPTGKKDDRELRARGVEAEGAMPSMARNDIIQEIGAGQRAKRKAQPPRLQDYLHAGLFIFLSSAVGVGAVMIVQYLGASGQSMWW